MTWVKLDDQFFTNPKVTAVAPLGRLLYMAGLCYCATALTDGEIHGRQLPVLHAQAGSSPKHVEQLVAYGLWIRHVDSYWVPDYLAYNPSREKVSAEREAARRRQARARDASRRDFGRTNGVSHGPPVPSPSVSSTDYERNTGQEAFAVQPPTDIRSRLRGLG